MALQAVKLAVSSGRLTTEDAQIIKRQMVQRVPFETVILKKLSRAERFCLLDYDQCEDDDEYDDISSTEEESEEKIKEEIQKDQLSIQNVICGVKMSSKLGINAFGRRRPPAGDWNHRCRP